MQESICAGIHAPDLFLHTPHLLIFYRELKFYRSESLIYMLEITSNADVEFKLVYMSQVGDYPAGTQHENRSLLESGGGHPQHPPARYPRLCCGRARVPGPGKRKDFYLTIHNCYV